MSSRHIAKPPCNLKKTVEAVKKVVKLNSLLHGIRIPDEQQEADRVFARHRKRIWKDLTRCKNRIKGLLAFSGIDIPEQYDNANWSHNFIKWLKEVDCKQQSRNEK